MHKPECLTYDRHVIPEEESKHIYKISTQKIQTLDLPHMVILQKMIISILKETEGNDYIRRELVEFSI